MSRKSNLYDQDCKDATDKYFVEKTSITTHGAEDLRINPGRQVELDYAKALAILFMIMVHCLEIFAQGSIIDDTTYGIVVEFFGSFTSATVFMVLLGVGIVYSRKAAPGYLAKRGGLLLAAGYLLNMLRGFFPMLVSWRLTGSDDWVSYMWIEPFRIDILQFAGLTFLFFGLAKKLRFSAWSFVAIWFVFEALNVVLVNYGFHYNDILDYKGLGLYIASLTGLFWGSSDLSSFPFLTWIFYPIAGYLFGGYLIKQDAHGKKRLFATMTWVSAMVFAITLVVCWYFEIDYGWETDAAFYHHLILGNLVFGSCAIMLMGFVYYISRFLPKLLQKTLSRWSINVTEIYFIQWILIGWIAVVTDYNLFGVIETIAVTVAVLVASDWLALLYIKHFTRGRLHIGQ